MTITKLDLTRHLSDTVCLSTKDCAALVDTLFDTIRSTLATGEDVKLSGFGNFILHEKRARPGRNPKNGETVEIAARRVVTFRASSKVKRRCTGAVVLELPAFGKTANRY
ncbi:integration host factor subunit alpha [Acidithiobacillus ferrooxidans]|uniref:Integration host factor subunit alpha n=1 Tax=Acidithiobacillus ferrooxidans TaxID=920 RepID=A0A2W1KHH3_ACIFR|nr:integration host factor subunit alpha [Acidithiobacillus ferrooxidans]MBU2817610.1 integration host factor subunit alpha [Acidithiobacillus ferrooxidans]MCR1341888.1 integration host factor subunit alpha [Acidithiobacillus ferrooxidans]PZD81875.1 integration host factor subunit alpha [Acidithiobacillus ferrooxidans]QLK41835.1 integration host factor subunit alpha [Acidithiobacillus ferrooxidans]QZT53789.1 integration host factor subunit alpha [Acidithiobacillus ferrooxidans]